jgi:hypothetical protein
MPESQTQPNTAGSGANPPGGPRVTPQPDLKQQQARPSDAEVAHEPNEGGAARDPRQERPEVRDAYADQNRGGLGGRRTKDLSGEAQTGDRRAERGGRLGA